MTKTHLSQAISDPYVRELKEEGAGSEIKQLTEAFKTNATEIKNAQEKAANEIKELGEASAETKAALETAMTGQDELKTRFEKLDEKLIEMEKESKRLASKVPVERKTAGQLFVASEIFEGVKSANRGTDQPFVVEKKDISGVTGSAGALVRPDRDPEVYRNPNRPLRIRDLIPSIPTSSSSVEVMRQDVFTNAAAPQGTVAGTGAGELAVKAKSEITWNLETYSIPTIAHWVPASRQVLSDAPQLQSLIDLDLEYGLDLEGDQQLLVGTGTGQDMEGLLVDAAIPDLGEFPLGTPVADVPALMIDKIRTAITTCQTNEYYNMTGLILNPADWETLETAKATDGHYLMIQFPAEGAQERLWRVPVVVTNAMPLGEFLIGDFTMGAKIYDREQKEIRVSESHADYFVKNGVAVLAEERYVMAVVRPLAFTKGKFTISLT